MRPHRVACFTVNISTYRDVSVNQQKDDSSVQITDRHVHMRQQARGCTCRRSTGCPARNAPRGARRPARGSDRGSSSGSGTATPPARR